MNRSEVMKKLMLGTDAGRSQLNLRNEEMQKKKKTGRRIDRLKREIQKKSKLCVIMELAFPFNPTTGEADDTFNSGMKYRPPYSATTVALSMKAMADSNEALKATLMRNAGVTEWDTSSEEFTQADWEIFNCYRVPRIFSLPVVTVSIPKIGGDYGAKYFITQEQFDNSLLKPMSKLCRDVVYEKNAKLQLQVDNGELKITDKELKELKSKSFKDGMFVSDVGPMNFLQIIEIPCDVTFQYNKENLDAATPVTVNDMMVVDGCKSAVMNEISSYEDGEYADADIHFDYIEIDMKCPKDGDNKSNNGKAQISRSTTYNRPQHLVESPTFDKALSELIDGGEDIEARVKNSVFVKDFDETAEAEILQALPTVLDIKGNEYATKKVLQANHDIIIMAYGEEGAELLEDIEADISDKETGNLDESASAEERSKFSITDLVGAIGDGEF